MKAQDPLSKFLVSTRDRGYTIKLDDPGGWDGTANYTFRIQGESDSEY